MRMKEPFPLVPTLSRFFAEERKKADEELKDLFQEYADFYDAEKVDNLFL